MSHTRRLAVYLAQTGRAYHTPAQIRRSRKKLNKVKEEQPAAARTTAPAARPCGGTDFCITSSGAKARKTHVKCA